MLFCHLNFTFFLHKKLNFLLLLIFTLATVEKISYNAGDYAPLIGDTTCK